MHRIEKEQSLVLFIFRMLNLNVC